MSEPTAHDANAGDSNAPVAGPQAEAPVDMPDAVDDGWEGDSALGDNASTFV
jgi:hypothetical protein